MGKEFGCRVYEHTNQFRSHIKVRLAVKAQGATLPEGLGENTDCTNVTCSTSHGTLTQFTYTGYEREEWERIFVCSKVMNQGCLNLSADFILGDG